MSSQMFHSQEKLDYFCFLIFLCFCVVCGLYVWFNVPETKNRTALEIAAEFRKMHSKPGEPQSEINTKQEVNKIQTNETKFWLYSPKSFSSEEFIFCYTEEIKTA